MAKSSAGGTGRETLLILPVMIKGPRGEKYTEYLVFWIVRWVDIATSRVGRSHCSAISSISFERPDTERSRPKCQSIHDIECAALEYIYSQITEISNGMERMGDELDVDPRFMENKDYELGWGGKCYFFLHSVGAEGYVVACGSRRSTMRVRRGRMLSERRRTPGTCRRGRTNETDTDTGEIAHNGSTRVVRDPGESPSRSRSHSVQGPFALSC